MSPAPSPDPRSLPSAFCGNVPRTEPPSPHPFPRPLTPDTRLRPQILSNLSFSGTANHPPTRASPVTALVETGAPSASFGRQRAPALFFAASVARPRHRHSVLPSLRHRPWLWLQLQHTAVQSPLRPHLDSGPPDTQQVATETPRRAVPGPGQPCLPQRRAAPDNHV